MYNINLIIYTVLLFCGASADNSKTFPRTVSFGTTSSAYQIEGYWNKEGKSENIWDHWIHSDPTRIKDNATADDTLNSYRSPLLDAYYISRIGFQHYQFSIPWSRILPTGFADVINMKAIMHYQSFIKYLQYYNVTPVVTLYYYDLPQSLQDIGGWTNPEMAKYFEDYARICFQFFGSSVERWITFNDPRSTCRRGYGDGTFAPGVKSDGIGEYVCAYTILKAHAAAYHVYKEEFKDLAGKLSIAIDMMWSEPTSTEDKDAVERRNAFEFGLYANPIYKGNWPKEVIERVEYRSKNENFAKSRLPEFTDEEIDYINGTSDFMAISLFHANMVEDIEEDAFGEPCYSKDMKVKLYLNEGWTLAVNQQPIVPWSARKTLAWLKSSFNDPEIFITANGIPDIMNVFDSTRISYFRDYLTSILEAIMEDEVKLIGYTAYSLYDSFEWTDGYSYKFGLYWIAYDDSGTHYKYDKNSITFYQQFLRTFSIPEETTTSTTTTTTTTVPSTTPGSATRFALCPVLILTTAFLVQMLF